MKICSTAVALATLLLAFWTAGCSTGKPEGMRAETLRPDQIHNFAVLYKENCAACHGDNGMNGAALPLNNPVYLAWAGHDRMLQIASNGVPNHLMPGFAPSAGGLLTNQQVEDIVNGMISNWGKPDTVKGVALPGYASSSKGDVTQGQAAYKIYCSRCHGDDGNGVPAPQTDSARIAASKTGKAVGSIVDPTYLSLISEQGLRDIIVAGMPRQGMPDWRNDAAGKPMSDADITNVIAWMRSKQVPYPGQPFPQLFQH